MLMDARVAGLSQSPTVGPAHAWLVRFSRVSFWRCSSLPAARRRKTPRHPGGRWSSQVSFPCTISREPRAARIFRWCALCRPALIRTKWKPHPTPCVTWPTPISLCGSGWGWMVGWRSWRLRSTSPASRISAKACPHKMGKALLSELTDESTRGVESGCRDAFFCFCCSSVNGLIGLDEFYP